MKIIGREVRETIYVQYDSEDERDADILVKEADNWHLERRLGLGDDLMWKNLRARFVKLTKERYVNEHVIRR